MQTTLFEDIDDNLVLDGKKVMIGVSGGINSAAVAVWLAELSEQTPEELHLVHIDLKEHSPDTMRFVQAVFDYCKAKMKCKVFTKVITGSVNSFFRNDFKGICAPQLSACTRLLKIIPCSEYMHDNKIDYDLVGYVRSERKRLRNQIKRGDQRKVHPIKYLSDADCFSLVDKYIGWHPKIYDILWTDKRIGEALSTGYFDKILSEVQIGIIRRYHVQGSSRGGDKRVFKHNNCLPCKNANAWQYALISLFYPDYFDEAEKTAKLVGGFWGRRDEYNEDYFDCGYCAD